MIRSWGFGVWGSFDPFWASVSAFILDQAYEAAQQVLREQDHYYFSLTEQEWKEFCAVLDAPPKRNPALRRLMNTPSVFEKDVG
jgi:uncharacterized protein (DUF1778 family)